MLTLVIVCVVGGVLGCGFVHVRTRGVTNGDLKRGLEREIVSLEKEIDTLELRVAQATDRETLMMRLHMEGSELVQIENQYRTLRGVPVARVAMRVDTQHSLDGH